MKIKTLPNNLQSRRFLFLLFLIVAILTLMSIYGCHSLYKYTYDTYDIKLKSIKKFISLQNANQVCVQPILPIYDEEIVKFIHHVPPLDCPKDPEEMVQCKGPTCSVLEKYKTSSIDCDFKEIIRVSDFNNRITFTNHGKTHTLNNSDFLEVYCRKGLFNSWTSTLMGIRHSPEIWKRTGWSHLDKRAMKLNVLMFGIDSMSRNNFIRKLPKTYNHLINELGALVLEGYNIVGDGTPQALIPILTGQTEVELPDTRKRMSNTQYVNVYPFVWNDYRNSGYVTGYLEDSVNYGTFDYRLNGFGEPPTDHYSRPFFVQVNKMKWKENCAGSKPLHKVVFNYVEQFYDYYISKPKFFFNFIGELSHDDYNLVEVIDDDVVQFLKNIKHHLHNTILIVMADHGHRFAQIRNTLQGKLEERLPFFSFTFPEIFKRKYPEAYENFKINTKRLTTPFDIYSTLKDVLSLEHTGMGDPSKRSISLFSEVPSNRSCAMAFIEPHWCACLNWQSTDPNSWFSRQLAQSFVDFINNYTSPYRRLCEQLTLKKIFWVHKLYSNEYLIKFKQSKDMDGMIPDMSGDTVTSKETYQLKVQLMPGQSLFEVSLFYDLKSGKVDIRVSDISRIDMYRKQAGCVESAMGKFSVDLRKFCYCK